MYDGDHLFELLGTDEYTYVDDRAADQGTGVTNLAFIKATLRRRVRFWCTFAVVGMVLGLAITLKSPPYLSGVDVAPSHPAGRTRRGLRRAHT